MNISIKLAIIGALVALASITSRGQGILTATNGGIAFRVWNGTTGNIVIASATTGCTITMEDTLSATVAASTNLLSNFLTQLGALTNKSGNVKLTFDGSLSLASDPVTNKFIAATITNTPATWGNVYWDSSKTKWQGVAIPRAFQMDRWTGNTIPDPLRPAAVWLQAARIIGQPMGSGQLTVNTYLNGALSWQESYDSPYYTLAANGTNNTSSDTIRLNDPIGLPIGSQQSFLVRIARGTASTDSVVTVVTKTSDQILGITP